MPQSNKDQYNDYQREYQLRRYHKRMAVAKEVLGGTCAVCGGTDDLQIDHTEWRTKSIKLNKLWSISMVRFAKELEKCQLLCSNHHIEKSRTDISERKRELGGANQYGPYGGMAQR